MKQAPEITPPVIQNIRAREISRYPANRTPDEESVKRMKDSIKENGILQPVTVRPMGNGYQLIFGETRWRGAKALHGDYPVPCHVVDADDKEAARLHAVENFQRTELDVIEAAKAMANMKENGWTVDEIAKEVGQQKSFVYGRLKLLELPEVAKKSLVDGVITLHTAEKLLSLPQPLIEKAVEDVVNPANLDRSLTQKEALQMIENKYAGPMKEAAEWASKRALAAKEYPNAVFLEYEEAVKCSRWNSGYVSTEESPAASILSDAANCGELVIPTWGDLARKHGAKRVVGIGFCGELEEYVMKEPLIDAEVAAMEDKPTECVFVHPSAVKAAIERRNAEQIRCESLWEEVTREKKGAIDLLLHKHPIDMGVLAFLLMEVIEDLYGGELLSEVFGVETEDEALKCAKEYLIDDGADRGSRLFLAVETIRWHYRRFGRAMFKSGLMTSEQIKAHREYALESANEDITKTEA